MKKDVIKRGKCVLTFFNMYSAMQSEKVIKSKKLYVKVIPVPRKISSDCTVAIEFDCDDEKEIMRYLSENNIEYQGLHRDF